VLITSYTALMHRPSRAREELSWLGQMLLRTGSVVLLLLGTIALLVAGLVSIGWAVITLLKHYAGS
jgi:hypothetical protein